jgi:hypothetical protein
MRDLEEQCVCVKFCSEVAKSFTGTFLMLKQSNQSTQYYEWNHVSNQAECSPKTIPKLDSLPHHRTMIMFRVCTVICEYLSQTVPEVSEEKGISKSPSHTILTKKLLIRVAAHACSHVAPCP